METRIQRVVLETAFHRIVGDMTLPREGYLSRISDYLNQSDQTFVALTNVTIIDGDPSTSGVSMERDFVAVGTAHIQLAYPDE